MSNIEKIQINQANIKHNHLYLSSIIGFFPIDVVGGSNGDDIASRLVKIILPFGEEVMTDIIGDKKIFRKRSWVGQLYKYRNAKPGDNVLLKWVAPYHLEIELEGSKQMNESKIGQTIQISIDKVYWLDRKKFEIPSEYIGFIPRDALGARAKTDLVKYPERGMPIEFDYGIEKSLCDVATRTSGVMRPRDNSGMRKFLEAYKAELGDVVCVTKVGERLFKVSLVKR